MRFIKIYDNIAGWQWYQDSCMVHLFIHFILKANYQDAYFMGKLIKRGQLATGRKSLSLTLGMSEMKVRERLKKLQNTKEITIETTNSFSIITLCNYEKYQTKQLTKEPMESQWRTTTEEIKEVKEEKNKIKQQLFADIKKFFGFESEIKFIARWPEILAYLNQFNEAELKHIESEFDFYKKYKAESKEKIHSFSSFVNNEWSKENWEKKYSDWIKKNPSSTSAKVERQEKKGDFYCYQDYVLYCTNRKKKPKTLEEFELWK